MIRDAIQAAINDQIRQELASSYSYLGMVAYFEHENLTGFAHWCRLQYEEEQTHAMRLFQYLLDRGGRISLAGISAPACQYDSPLAAFREAMAQEEANTRAIDEIYRLASAEHDHATISHLQWFVDEQVEEEKVVGEVVSLVERAKDDINAMLYLNDRLGQRTEEDAAG